jgi:hypothetical protein
MRMGSRVLESPTSIREPALSAAKGLGFPSQRCFAPLSMT